MNNIEDIINIVCENDIDIPVKIQNRINYTLKNKKKETHYFRKLVTAIISILCTIIGSFGVYAMNGGTIDGIPASDWLGIKFSNQYIEYKKPVENQIIAFEDTSVELTSTLCNEGITILEFDIKLSEDDYKKLKLDENIITDEYLQGIENYKSNLKKDIERNLKDKLYNEEIQRGNYNADFESLVIPEEKIQEEYDKLVAESDKNVEERRNTGFLPALSLNYNQIGGTYNYDKFNPNMEWYASINIDDTPYYVKNWEIVEKVNDYQYKIYVMYSITDDILEGKEEFKITLKNNKLVDLVNWKTLAGWRNDCQWFARNWDAEMMRTPETEVIDLPGEFEVNVSKNDILEDSIIIENPGIKSEFRNISHTVEKAVITPIQTIVKVNHSATQQSSNAYANRYSNPNIEHLPLTREYKVYDANGNKLSCFATSNKSTLIYSDGTREDYDTHDVPNKKYSNAIWENVDYLLIENTDTDYIKIVPVETLHNPLEETDEYVGEVYYEMDPLIININKQEN